VTVVIRFHSEPGFSRGRGRSEDRRDTWAILNLIGKSTTPMPRQRRPELTDFAGGLPKRTNIARKTRQKAAFAFRQLSSSIPLLQISFSSSLSSAPGNEPLLIEGILQVRLRLPDQLGMPPYPAWQHTSLLQPLIIPLGNAKRA